MHSRIDLIAFSVEFIRQCHPVLKILILKNRGKLITAYAENRAMLEHAADQPACSFQVFVAFLMPVTVIDPLQIVAVKNPDCKTTLLFNKSIHPAIPVHKKQMPLCCGFLSRHPWWQVPSSLRQPALPLLPH